uniref:Uncharacterized protein n=1 Tax=Davidia involucrata TaxID=16924 RepID=A0A5B7BAJ4_DAVIN
MFRKLDERDNPLEKTIEMSPSPSPVPSVNISLGGVDNVDQGSSVDRQAPAPLPKEEPIDRVTDERCDISSNRCPDNKNMIACLSHAGTDQYLSKCWRKSNNCIKCWKWKLCNSHGISSTRRQLLQAIFFLCHLCNPHQRCLPTIF